MKQQFSRLFTYSIQSIRKRRHIIKTIPLPYGNGTVSASLKEDRIIDAITAYTPAASQEAPEKAGKLIGHDDASVTMIPDGAGITVEPPYSDQ